MLVDENIPGAESALASFGRVQRFSGRSLTRSQLIDTDVLLVRSVTSVNEALLSGTPVRFVGSATSGIDHIDVSYLQDCGIHFAHAGGANANSVVEYVLSAIAAVDDRLERLLAGETCGIVGYGQVGKTLAARFQALGIACRIYDPWLERSNVPGAVDLEEALACEVVCLHPELTEQAPYPSRHLVSRDTLPLLQPGALLINASRGGVIDNLALFAHLNAGNDLLTVLDVWEDEPHINVALLKEVTLATPHIAGYSLDSKIVATRMLARAMATALGLSGFVRQNNSERQAPLILADCLSGAALVRTLVHAYYDVREDDGRLRREGASEISEHFDRIRKNYPERRELAGSSIKLPVGFSDLSTLEALGCEIVDGDISSG